MSDRKDMVEAVADFIWKCAIAFSLLLISHKLDKILEAVKP